MFLIEIADYQPNRHDFPLPNQGCRDVAHKSFVLRWKKNVRVEFAVCVKVKNPLSVGFNPFCWGRNKLEDEAFEPTRLFKSTHFVADTSNNPRVEVFNDGCRVI